MNVIKTVVVLLFGVLNLNAQIEIPSIYSIGTCPGSNTGSIQIEFLHDLELYPLAYTGVYINEDNAEVGILNISNSQFTIENLSIGEYSISINLDQSTQMEFCASVEEDLNLMTQVNIISSPCCEGKITVDILEEFDNNPTFRLLQRDGQNGWIQISNGPIINDKISVENLCANRYRLEINSDDCAGYVQTISLPNESSEPTLLGINHVQVCDEGTTDDFNSMDGEIHISVDIESNYTIKWYEEGNGISIGQGESITGLTHGDYIARVTLDGSNCLLMEGEYTICCCGQNDNSECTVSASEPVILGDVHNATNATSFDGSIDITFVEGSNFGLIYNWTGPNNFHSTDEDLLDLEPGTYTISYTLGCAITHSRTFIVGNEELCSDMHILADSRMTCALNPQLSIGEIKTIVFPPGNYLYQWSNGQTGDVLRSFEAGVYTVTITNSTGCSIIQSFVLEESNIPLIGHVELSVPTGCQTLMEIQGEVIIESGNPPYTFNWSTGSTNITSDMEVGHDIDYSVTITDDCNFVKVLNGNYNCQDDELCNDDCIRIRKTGNPICFDLCEGNFGGLFEFKCDKWIIESNCDDGVKRTVQGNAGTWLTFVGDKLENGDDEFKEDISSINLPDHYYWITNHLTGCRKLVVKNWPDYECGGIFSDIIDWINEEFSPGGGGSTNIEDGCNGNWEIEYYDSKCLGSRYCPDTDTYEEIYIPLEICKMNIPEDNVIKTYCAEDCSLISTTTLSSEWDVDDLDYPWCSDCNLGFTVCDDIVNFQDIGIENGVTLYSHSQSTDSIQFKILEYNSKLNVWPYHDKWFTDDLVLKEVKLNISGALLHLEDNNSQTYIKYVSSDNDYEVYYDTLTHEIIEDITVDSLSSVEFNLHYVNSITNKRHVRKYNYAGIVSDIELTLAPTIEHVFWSTPISYVELSSSSNGYILNCVGNRSFVLNNRISRNYNVTNAYLSNDKLVVSGFFKGSIEINGITYTSWEQGNNYSSIVMVYDEYSNLIQIKTYKSIITKTIYKSGIVYVSGYIIDSDFKSTQEEEVLEEVVDRCGFVDIILLENAYQLGNRNNSSSYDLFDVYPNPTNNEFNIILNQNTKENYSIKLFDVSGRILFDEKNINESIYKLNVNSLENGMYILGIYKDEIQVYIESVIKL